MSNKIKISNLHFEMQAKRNVKKNIKKHIKFFFRENQIFFIVQACRGDRPDQVSNNYFLFLHFSGL